jgi:hypothetical protein
MHQIGHAVVERIGPRARAEEHDEHGEGAGAGAAGRDVAVPIFGVCGYGLYWLGGLVYMHI